MSITMSDGTRHKCRVDYPKGDPRNPLTEKELETKFTSLACMAISEEKARALSGVVSGLEGEANLGRLMSAMVTD